MTNKDLQKELKEKEVLIKDCQEKKEFVIKHGELVNWVCSHLLAKKST